MIGCLVAFWHRFVIVLKIRLKNHLFKTFEKNATQNFFLSIFLHKFSAVYPSIGLCTKI